MIVIVIVAIITAVAVLSFGDFGASRNQQIQIEQLTQVIETAQQQAILQPAVLGLEFTANGYQFYHFWHNAKKNTDSWIPLRNDALSRKNAFPKGTKIKLSGMKSKSKKIVFLPSGYVTHFKVDILFPDQKNYLIDVSDDGEITINGK